MPSKKHMHRDWPDLARHYREFRNDPGSNIAAMAALCDSIASSHMADRLYGHTSVIQLRISQTPTTDSRDPEVQWLTIEPAGDGMIKFTFDDTWQTSKHWTRTVKSADTLHRFNRFLRQVGWSYRGIGG